MNSSFQHEYVAILWTLVAAIPLIIVGLFNRRPQKPMPAPPLPTDLHVTPLRISRVLASCLFFAILFSPILGIIPSEKVPDRLLIAASILIMAFLGWVLIAATRSLSPTISFRITTDGIMLPGYPLVAWKAIKNFKIMRTFDSLVPGGILVVFKDAEAYRSQLPYWQANPLGDIRKTGGKIHTRWWWDGIVLPLNVREARAERLKGWLEEYLRIYNDNQ